MLSCDQMLVISGICDYLLLEFINLLKDKLNKVVKSEEWSKVIKLLHRYRFSNVERI